MSNFGIRLRGHNNTYNDLINGNSWSVVAGSLSTAEGKFGGESLNFNGSTFIRLTTTLKNIQTTDDYTIVCWAKTSASSGIPTIVLVDFGSSQAIFLYTCRTYDPYRATTVTLSLNKTTYDPRSTSSINVADGNWHHYAICKKQNILYWFIDGNFIDTLTPSFPTTNILLPDGGFSVGGADNYTYFNGQIDDLCVVGSALWTDNFTPPTNYLSLNNVIYLSGQEAWGIDSNNTFSKLSNNWASETNTNKIAIFNATDGKVPTTAQLETLTMPIKAIVYNEDNVQSSCTVLALPEPQIIEPKELIDVSSYRAVKNVSLDVQGSGTGVVKVAVTHDLSTYEIWQNNEWVQIFDIATEGMTPTELSSIPQTAWTEDFNIVYYLETPTVEDNKEINTLILTVDTYPPLVSQTLGTNYTYQYERPNILSVTFNQNGNYRVNYVINSDNNVNT